MRRRSHRGGHVEVGAIEVGILRTMTDHSSPDDAAAPAQDREETKLAVRVTADRILCAVPDDSDRRTKAGILIPATAKSADRRGVWADVTEVGPLVRGVEAGDRVLFLPDAAIEVDVRGEVFLIVRERDVHAVGSGERAAGKTGLYL
jgi:chaperonin GroES